MWFSLWFVTKFLLLHILRGLVYQNVIDWPHLGNIHKLMLLTIFFLFRGCGKGSLIVTPWKSCLQKELMVDMYLQPALVYCSCSFGWAWQFCIMHNLLNLCKEIYLIVQLKVWFPFPLHSSFSFNLTIIGAKTRTAQKQYRISEKVVRRTDE